MKKEIAIDAATAARLFVKEYPHLSDGWEKNIPGKLENAADAGSIPEDVQKIWSPARWYPRVHAKVVRFSEKELIVLVLEHKGTYLCRLYYECKGLFRLARDKEVDALFNVSALEKTYGAMHKGLKQGDPVGEVTRKLGEPDARITYQPFGYYKLCYFQDNVIITIDGFRVESFDFGVPQSLRDEVTKNGPHITRY